jgi:hypothetical protein
MRKEAENKDIGTDLCKFAFLLQRYAICSDTGPLHSAGAACIGSATASKWGYRLNKIVFLADEVGGRLTSDSREISISLSIVIEGQEFDSMNINNPLNYLQLDLEIDGVRLNPTSCNIENLYAAWHLDRHIFGPNDNKTKYCHPLYHFTFGGEKMEAKGHDSFGIALIMPSPRLIYPPMDAVLGIDFILQNYLHKDKIKHLIQDPDYIEIIRKSQERIWKPFFCSLYTHWDKNSYMTEPDFTPLKILPLYY